MASINELVSKANKIQKEITDLEVAKAAMIADFDAKIEAACDAARPAYEMLCGLRDQVNDAPDYSEFEGFAPIAAVA